VVPKITSVMSMVAVCIIIYRVLSTKSDHRRVYDRLLLGMSIMNFFGSFAFFLGTWTFGNSGFCTFQGWVLQINSAVFWYNGVLATNFLLRIVFEWKEDDTERIEVLLHVIAWSFPAITSFVCLGLGMYGPAGPWCWIESPPYDWARWALFYAELWALMLYTAAIMFVIVVKVHRSDLRTKQHSNTAKKKRMSKKTREVAVQGIFFVLCFWITWIFGSANRIQNALAPAGCTIFALVFLHRFFLYVFFFFKSSNCFTNPFYIIIAVFLFHGKAFSIFWYTCFLAIVKLECFAPKRIKNHRRLVMIVF